MALVACPFAVELKSSGTDDQGYWYAVVTLRSESGEGWSILGMDDLAVQGNEYFPLEIVPCFPLGPAPPCFDLRLEALEPDRVPRGSMLFMTVSVLFRCVFVPDQVATFQSIIPLDHAPGGGEERHEAAGAR